MYLFYVSDIMEGLYHQTNSLLEQTQGYFVRLEQGAVGEDSERLQNEIQVRERHLKLNTFDAFLLDKIKYYVE